MATASSGAAGGISEHVIFSWLGRIGLEHAVPMFQAEGITTPAALSNLKMEDYERLGITTADDHKRLFELVGRVKQVRFARGGGRGDAAPARKWRSAAAFCRQH